MEYPGYILSNHLPSVKDIHNFTDELINYLFPVTDDPEMFLEYHEATLYKLQRDFNELLRSVDKSGKLNKDGISDHFFEELFNVKELLMKDARLILDFDPAATRVGNRSQSVNPPRKWPTITGTVRRSAQSRGLGWASPSGLCRCTMK